MYVHYNNVTAGDIIKYEVLKKEKYERYKMTLVITWRRLQFFSYTLQIPIVLDLVYELPSEAVTVAPPDLDSCKQTGIHSMRMHHRDQNWF